MSHGHGCRQGTIMNLDSEQTSGQCRGEKENGVPFSGREVGVSPTSLEAEYNFDKYAYRQEPLRSSTESEDEYKPICRPKVHNRGPSPICNREKLRQIRRRRLLGPESRSCGITNADQVEPTTPCVDVSVKGSPKEGVKVKTKREPLPMCRRALPHSFFKEPHSINTSSLAGDFYPVLPPLFSAENEDVADVRPVTPPHGQAQPQPPKKAHRSTEPNTELLFSLFNHLEEPFDKRLLVRRGRPKKQPVEKPAPPPIPKENEDPCIVDALSERLFPKLSLGSNQGRSSGNGPLPIGVIRYSNTSRAIEFPAITSEQNYAVMLSELVTHM